MKMQAVVSTPLARLHDTEKRWFAVQTRPRCEKFVQRQLDKKGIDAYVPLQTFLRRYERKSRLVELPLIPAYVFVHISRQQYVSVLETENITGFVRHGRDIIPIPEAEMDTLRRITLEKTLEAEAVRGKFAVGDAVEIAAGYLAGLKGMLVKVEGKRRLQVELQHLGYSLLINVDASVLQTLK